jgi:serine protease AprX
MISEPAPRPRVRRSRRFYVIASVLIVILVAAVSASVYAILLLLSPPEQRIDSAWVLEQTGAAALHARGLTGNGMAVCLLDSGIDAEHPYLASMTLAAWKDFIASSPAPYDDNGHGTYMSSLIVARGPVTGVAPGVSLIVGKVIRGDGGGEDSTASAGIDFCLEKQADVISLSWGGKSKQFAQTRTEEAVARALSLGVFVVASAGNDGPDNKDVASPASLPAVIAVGAVDRSGEVGDFSSKGANTALDHPPFGRQDPDKKPETVAPGVEVAGAWPDSKYVIGDGTSQATAIVSGLVALLLEAHPDYRRASQAKVAAFKSAMMGSCSKLPGQSDPHDDHLGYGRIDAVRLEALL